MAKILLADDNDSVRRVIARGLKCEGHNVDEVADGNQALDAVKENDYDVIITDMIMPGLNGADMIRELQVIKQGVKVIAISGGDLMEPEVYLQEAQELGVVSCLLKPFMIDELFAEVDRLMAL